MDEFFARNIIAVFFVYGLAFFCMGLAVLLEISRASELDFAKALKPLAGFGLVHGSHEWFEMGIMIHTRLSGEVNLLWIYSLRLLFLGISFLLLIAFGTRMISGPGRPIMKWSLIAAISATWLVGLTLILRHPLPELGHFVAGDTYTRYALAIPGAALTAWGLLLQGRLFRQAGMKRFSLDAVVAAVAFGLYGAIGQLFTSQSTIFPSSIFNAEKFIAWVGFPIQGFRALMAIIAAVAIIHSLRAFEEENRRRIQRLSEAQRREQQRLQELREELLHRTVQAQELERQRIARELHDETGQVLTALGLGLHGLAATIPANPERAIQQSHQLQELATNGLEELQHLVAGLRPPQLDELGLLPALRWYAAEMKLRYGLTITVNGNLGEVKLTEEIKLTIFRIAQEALTNIIRHAQATQALVIIDAEKGRLQMDIEDDGCGFDVESILKGTAKNCLGLLGMIERAALVGGECTIKSQPREGTHVTFELELPR